MQENRLIAWLQAQATAAFQAAGVMRHIGDDAAVLSMRDDVGVSSETTGHLDRNLVVTTDLIADGVHFDSTTATLEQIGWKAMAVNLSDLAAMAAEPWVAFVSLLLPTSYSQDDSERLMQALTECGDAFQCQIVGGDTNSWSGKLAINVTVLGKTTASGPLRRDTAKPGDILIVSGTLGGSIAGRHLTFPPRIAEALLLHSKYKLHAGMDLSDGLALDLRRMCVQSGCGAELLLDEIPVSKAAYQLAEDDEEALRRALGDGEDFELLLAVPEGEARRMLDEQPLDVPLTMVGRCIDGSGVYQRVGSDVRPLPELGYEHGERSSSDGKQPDS